MVSHVGEACMTVLPILIDGVLWMLYALSTVFLVLYCLNCYVLMVLHRRARPQMLHHDTMVWQAWSATGARVPRVTIQLPLYNERYVVQRLIEAVVRLRYPQDRLEIQVLDDSTDETTGIAARLVEQYRQEGVAITLHHRPHRRDYKAGALQEGLASVTGEFIAIFDADFVPEADFLLRTLPFFQDPTLAMVQVRWGHLNREYSGLTLALTFGLDGHFWVEQTARCWSGLFLNFNGSGGIWRRDAIADAGGWQADTLTEDLDLSYRAQLRGWRLKFLPQVVCPAELPVQMAAIKSQQYRWAKGSIQTAKKLLPHVLRAPIPLVTKGQAVLHLTGYLIHLFIVFTALVAPLPFWFAEAFPDRGSLVSSVVFTLAACGPASMSLYAQAHLYPDWKRRLYGFPLLLLFGTGIALSNTTAILGALCNRRSPFIRTPKFRIETPADTWIDKAYHLPLPWLSLGELCLAGYCATGLLLAWQQGEVLANPYLFLYTAGFAAVALVSLWEFMQRRVSRCRRSLSIKHRPR
jgi:cellulose synthase/poly-beta-1,6-N-acetylglucosamine synthase-like glycosyltransferase